MTAKPGRRRYIICSSNTGTSTSKTTMWMTRSRPDTLSGIRRVQAPSKAKVIWQLPVKPTMSLGGRGGETLVRKSWQIPRRLKTRSGRHLLPLFQAGLQRPRQPKLRGEQSRARRTPRIGCKRNGQRQPDRDHRCHPAHHQCRHHLRMGPKLEALCLLPQSRSTRPLMRLIWRYDANMTR